MPTASLDRPPTLVHALDHVQRMRGGSQAHLMRCSDGFYYVVKFQNNPQHIRTLANEALGTLLAGRLGLPTAHFAIVEVGRELIRTTEELVVGHGYSLKPCREGSQFGSRYVCDPSESQIYNYLPDEVLADIENLSDFLGMLVFDKWTGNTDDRQAVFYRESGHTRFRAMMIDQGHCFNAEKWDYPDKSFIGIFGQRCVYRSVEGMGSFEHWLSIVEDQITTSWLHRACEEIPADWYDHDAGAFSHLVERLDHRRLCVRKLLEEAKMDCRQPFPNWK